MENVFGDGLVHCQCAALVASACVANAHQVESGLNAAIFAVSAMQGEESDVGLLAHLNHVWSEEGAAACHHSVDLVVETTHIGACLIHIVVGREKVGSVGILYATEHINQHSAVTFFAECLTNICARND